MNEWAGPGWAGPSLLTRGRAARLPADSTLPAIHKILTTVFYTRTHANAGEDGRADGRPAALWRGRAARRGLLRVKL